MSQSSTGHHTAATSAVPRKVPAGALVAQFSATDTSNRSSNGVDTLSGDVEVSDKSLLATITTCLEPCEICSGFYIDTITGHYLIKCSCLCHKIRQASQTCCTYTSANSEDGKGNRTERSLPSALTQTTRRRTDIFHHINAFVNYENQPTIAKWTRHDEYERYHRR